MSSSNAHFRPEADTGRICYKTPEIYSYAPEAGLRFRRAAAFVQFRQPALAQHGHRSGIASSSKTAAPIGSVLK